MAAEIPFQWKREKRLALGVFPDTSLAQAREKMRVAKLQLSEGSDSEEIKKQGKLILKSLMGNTFAVVGRELVKKPRQEAAATAADVLSIFSIEPGFAL